MKIRYNTTLNEDTIKALKHLAYVEDRDRNDIIEDALGLYIEQKNKTEEAPKKPKK